MTLRLLLPPNLAAAAPRDAIAVRVEMDLPPTGAASFPENLLPALAILQRLGVPPQPVSLIQLKRAQLKELVSALVQEPVFFLINQPTRPLPWNGLELPGVSDHLREPVSVSGGGVPPPRNSPRGEGTLPPVRKKAPEPEEEEDDLTPLTVDGSEHFLAITLPSRESMVYEAALEFLRAHRFVL